ncbi:MAG: hypothetical protein K2I49_02795, partial [Ureaplasma sp.]|nr:hypothetical protein [Ureaplasma sp.]
MRLDFSKTKLVEIKQIHSNSRQNDTLSIKLPNSCLRISRIIYNYNLDINLENVLYYEDYALSNCNFPNNINKNAQYFENTF